MRKNKRSGRRAPRGPSDEGGLRRKSANHLHHAPAIAVFTLVAFAVVGTTIIIGGVIALAVGIGRGK